jgi:KUP system potassium uptake protein
VSKNLNKVSAAGLVIALGIIYGDIGTSPLYVLNEIITGRAITEFLILGSLSCMIWTLTLQTTIKYVILTLKADNKGEGGIFSLYALVRRRRKWLVVPAMLGGAALLADGMITPPITVTSAIEGLGRYPDYRYNTEHHHHHRYRHHHRYLFCSAVWYRFYRQTFWPDHVYFLYHAGRTRRFAPAG